MSLCRKQWNKLVSLKNAIKIQNKIFRFFFSLQINNNRLLNSFIFFYFFNINLKDTHTKYASALSLNEFFN